MFELVSIFLGGLLFFLCAGILYMLYKLEQEIDQ